MFQGCECEKSSRIYVSRVFSNGVVHYGEQCLTCGRFFSMKKKDLENKTLYKFDEKISERYQQAKNLEYDRLIKERELEQEQKARQRREEYEQYIESDAWKRRRAKVLERDNWLCQGCLSRKAEHVHHLTYERLGQELAYDLISLCVICHDHAHGKEYVNLNGLLK